MTKLNWNNDLTDDEYEANELLAQEEYEIGEEPYFSTGICGQTTAGYGRLDEYGYWEFPLVVNQSTLEIIT